MCVGGVPKCHSLAGGDEGAGAAGSDPAEAEAEAEAEAGGGGWRSCYPPGYVVGGVRLERGRAAVSLRVPAGTPAGAYCVRFDAGEQGPAWAGEPVAPVYVAVTVT